MSFAALAAVSKMRANSAAEKLVALAYADRHNEETGCAYPSLAWLCEFSSLNRKTVIAAVIRLENAGFLTDTGQRQGNTRQIKVYRLNLESIPKTEPFQKRNHTENGTVPKMAGKESQKRDTDTVREPVSQKTPSSSKTRASKSRFVLPADIPADEWADYEEMRKLIRKPMSDSIREKAITRLRKLAEDGHPPGAVLSHSTLNNYQGLFPPPKDDRDGRRNQTHGMAGNRGGSGYGRTADAALDWVNGN